jgi:hypothetical protein
MSISPTISDWVALQEFYRKLAQGLHGRGIKSFTTGGIACVFYGLAQSTKDCDLIIPIESLPTVLDVLSDLTFRAGKCHLTLKYGAPLNEKWLNGGWSSHAFFGPPDVPMARVDLFGRPPRVGRASADENPIYLSRHGVAQMKKTRREKDWAFANLLGLQMLKRGDANGVLHLTDPRILEEVARQSPFNEATFRERPLLVLTATGGPELERYLKAEKEFWFHLDDLRLKRYEKAWVPFGIEIRKHPELLQQELKEQNRAMVEIASYTLDPAPLKDWENVVKQAKEHTAQIFQNLDIGMLPNPKAFEDQDDGLKKPGSAFEL